MNWQLYHNPRCSKSRAALAMLTERNINFEIVSYLENTLTSDEVKRILSLLGFTSARQLMRTGEAIYKELSLADIDDEQALISAIITNPKLIERPILVGDNKASIGRPLENIIAIL
ncbi:MAG: arsenate reductase (glutaredoxin) [Robiginitomaculum sp.]|nr:arsenate reductase (glutaredoxin) [Robiginitomaculum sp.]